LGLLAVDEDTPGVLDRLVRGVDGSPVDWQATSDLDAVMVIDGDTLVYVPPAGLSGLDTVTVKPRQGGVAGQPATLTVAIRPVNDPPTLTLAPSPPTSTSTWSTPSPSSSSPPPPGRTSPAARTSTSPSKTPTTTSWRR